MKSVTSERELALATMSLLSSTPTGEATYRYLLTILPSEIPLTKKDCEPSPTRPMERRWEQRVRNINSHRNEPSSLVLSGYLKPIPDGLAITEKGRDFIQSRP